jgi:hypothetical protein
VNLAMSRIANIATETNQYAIGVYLDFTTIIIKMYANQTVDMVHSLINKKVVVSLVEKTVLFVLQKIVAQLVIGCLYYLKEDALEFVL